MNIYGWIIAGSSLFVGLVLGVWIAFLFLRRGIQTVRGENVRLRGRIYSGSSKLGAVSYTAHELRGMLVEQRMKVQLLYRTVAFFRSVIKSGEGWSKTCQDAYNAAIPPDEQVKIHERRLDEEVTRSQAYDMGGNETDYRACSIRVLKGALGETAIYQDDR